MFTFLYCPSLLGRGGHNSDSTTAVDEAQRRPHSLNLFRPGFYLATCHYDYLVQHLRVVCFSLVLVFLVILYGCLWGQARNYRGINVTKHPHIVRK